MNPKDKIKNVFRLKEIQRKALEKLGIETLEDLLYHFPTRYSDPGEVRSIKDLKAGEKATVYGRIFKLDTKKAWKKKIPMATAKLEDDSGKIDIVWFHQPYIAKMLSDGVPVKISGKVSERNGKLNFANPEYEIARNLPTATSKGALFGQIQNEMGIVPTYPESRGVSSLWFYSAVDKLLKNKVHEQIQDPLPEDIRKKYNLPSIKSALVWIHKPKKDKDSEAARKRFAFEEVFFIQISRQRMRQEYLQHESFKIDIEDDDIDTFVERFPFTPTGAQDRAIKEIVKDLRTDNAMARLLEGDVGSGKTFVAATTSYAVVTNPPKNRKYGNLQVAYMAPTEVLASQLYESFIEYFSHMPIQIGLITGSGCKKFPSKVDPASWTNISRTQFLKWVANGEIPIVVGTHSLIQKTVKFKNLAYIIIDEQHRFGVNQRAELRRKDEIMPHLLSMTATPIPRTLALTIYGDLDLSVIDESPPGRKPPITELVTAKDRKVAYERVKEELDAGHQAYVIAPRIEEPDPEDENALQITSVEEIYKELSKKTFPDKKIGQLHGGMTSKKKAEIMEKFEKGDIDILVSTTVIEVGVNVPNATIIVIEGAERFGLAQLHQLRGRVQRSSDQAYCFLVGSSKSKRSKERLNALQKTKNGFELAEKDLLLRGPGELTGTSQWGISDIGMEAIKNIKMVEAARNEAEIIVNEDPELEKSPLLKEKSNKYEEGLHLE